MASGSFVNGTVETKSINASPIPSAVEPASSDNSDAGAFNFSAGALALTNLLGFFATFVAVVATFASVMEFALILPLLRLKPGDNNLTPAELNLASFAPRKCML